VVITYNWYKGKKGEGRDPLPSFSPPCSRRGKRRDGDERLSLRGEERRKKKGIIKSS